MDLQSESGGHGEMEIRMKSLVLVAVDIIVSEQFSGNSSKALKVILYKM